MIKGEIAVCTNEGKQDRAVGRHPGLDAPYQGEPPSHQGAPADIYGEAANSVQREARVGLQGGIGVAPGPKCIVAGCSNRFGEGGFQGELCVPCHRMLVTGHVQPAGTTFLHGMAGHISRQQRTPQELRNASLNLLNDLAAVTRRDAWWDTQGPSYIIAQHLEKYHAKGQS